MGPQADLNATSDSLGVLAQRGHSGSNTYPRIHCSSAFWACMRLPAWSKDDALRAVEDFIGHFLAAVGGQAVHDAGFLAGRAAAARR